MMGSRRARQAINGRNAGADDWSAQEDTWLWMASQGGLTAAEAAAQLPKRSRSACIKRAWSKRWVWQHTKRSRTERRLRRETIGLLPPTTFDGEVAA